MNRQQYDEHAHRMITWARLYAHRQWPVFPVASFIDGKCTCGWAPRYCTSPGKHPLTKRGSLDANVNPTVVDAMWKRYPGANIGIATGGAAGLAVLDADVADGARGKQSLQALAAKHGLLPPGPVVRTTRGGRHFYYLAPAGGIANSASRLGPGLDVRGNGGYVIAPPSVSVGGTYEWVNDWRTDLSEWPEWLIPAPIEPTPIRQPERLARVSGDKALAPLVDFVLASTPPTPGQKSGNRNERLYWACGKLAKDAVAGRISLDEGAAAILDAAARIGLPEHEAHRTLNSALRKVGVAA